MKKFGTRLISAVLAGCMMASVLPASAFAAGRTGSETGVSAQASENQGRILEDGEEITESGTYSMSGPYTKTVTINVPDGNVVINITGGFGWFAVLIVGLIGWVISFRSFVQASCDAAASVKWAGLWPKLEE